MVNWIHFPKNKPLDKVSAQIVKAFEAVDATIDSYTHQLKSDEVLTAVRPGLEALGFDVEKSKKSDENLARDIKDYVHGRKYGLVYEASKPEFVRMWKKPVVRGDIVNILPPRGVMEDTKNEDDPSGIVYKVIAISEGVATLRNEIISSWYISLSFCNKRGVRMIDGRKI